MKTKDYSFELPEELIAQKPLEKRDNSRLMVVSKKTGEIKDSSFVNILDYLNKGDVLVLNNSKVIPARLYGKRKDTGGKVEILLLERESNNIWNCLVKPGKKMKPGNEVVFSDKLEGKVLSIEDEGIRRIEFKFSGIFEEVLDDIGEMPLPPYIHEKLNDKQRYQTIYAKHNGSAAAPTAGLHFTDELLNKVKEKGIQLAYVTLHVGLGTFRPVQVEDVKSHKMHSEYFILDEENAEILKKAKKENRRIISVGTTSTRTLESVYLKKNQIEACSGWTDIFIYPGYKFGVIDGMITNFHLPESTLIMLVSALVSREKILDAYKHAVDEKYRFFSFGDAMLII
jgi:S-adenosylmethionine:tRNA ribosyltransferase-isomerase